MTITKIKSYQFILDNPLEIVDKPFKLDDNLHIIRSEAYHKTTFCLDNFDSSLNRSKRLLMQYENNLLLFQNRFPTVVKQKCPKKWRFISELNQGAVKYSIENCDSIRAYLPGAESTLTVEQYLLLDEDEKTHVRFNIYQLKADDKLLIFGITQPLTGYQSSHDLLQQYLSTQGARQLDSYDAIYQLCGFKQQNYVAKPVVEIKADEEVIETTVSIIKSSLQVARQNEEGIKSDFDTEFLHDYRVNLRKTRSVLSLFKDVLSVTETNRLKQDFSDIMKKTNRLRDLDVYLLDQEEIFSLLPKRMYPGLQQMFDIFRLERKKQLHLVVKMLNSKHYQHLMSYLQDKFNSSTKLEKGIKAHMPSLPFATKLIWKRYSKVCQIARKIDAQTPDEEIHQLRIHCKKLRYLMEFFSPLFPKKMLTDLIKSLKRLQNNLGRFNDFSVQQDSLQEFLDTYAEKHPKRNLLAMAESIGALLIVLNQKQLLERSQVIQSFSLFDSLEVREEFAEVFHHGVGVRQ